MTVASLVLFHSQGVSKHSVILSFSICVYLQWEVEGEEGPL
jgi:hypothetical protein